MKNKLKIILLVSMGIFLFSTCTKDPKLNMPDLKKSVIPLVQKDAAKDQNISFLNLAGFSGAVTVNVYYPDKPKSMNLMVAMNDDFENAAVVKSDITSYPTKVDFNLTSMIDLLPKLNSLSELKLGDYFRFYVDMILEDGTVIGGNDTLYHSFNSSVPNLPGSSINVIYTVACPLDPAKTVGTYHSVSADWASEGDITITADAADPNKLYVSGLETMEGLTEIRPLVMHINPLTYVVTADKTILVPLAWGYHNLAYEGKGTYNTCTGTYQMKFDISVTEGAWPGNNFTFTRK